MSHTYLDGVNDVLTRAGLITATGLLATFDTPSKQVYIDNAKQIWNETIDQVCNMMGVPISSTGSSSITLVTDTREYDLPSDLVQIRWPLIDQTNGNYIFEYPGGYEQMRIDQHIPADWEGLPYAAVINPTTNKLRFERTPTATENGKVYDMFYDKDLAMTDEDDPFPFSDATYRGLIPVVTEGFERRQRNDFDKEEYRKQLARALSFSNKAVRRTNW